MKNLKTEINNIMALKQIMQQYTRYQVPGIGGFNRVMSNIVRGITCKGHSTTFSLLRVVSLEFSMTLEVFNNTVNKFYTES